MFVVLFDALILPFQLAFKIPGVDGCDFQTARRQQLAILAHGHAHDVNNTILGAKMGL